MRGKTSHTSKTLTERANYQKALAKVDTEPTLDESIDFKQSNKMDEEKARGGLAKKRPISIDKKIKKFVSNNWISLLLTVLLAFAGYLFVESRTALSSIEKDIEIQQHQLDRLSASVDDNDSESKRQIQLIQSDIDSLRDKVENSNKVDSAHDVLLAEIRLRIEFIIEQMTQQE